MALMRRNLVLIRLPMLALGATIMTLGSAAAQTPDIRYSNPATMAKPTGYTHVVEVNGPGRTIYIADSWDMTAPASKARISASRRRWSTKT
jgi:hypothetical protein